MDELPSPPRGKNSVLRTIAVALIAGFVGVVLFAEFLAPYDHSFQSRSQPSAPPSAIHFFDAEGAFHPRSFIYKREVADPLAGRYEEDRSQAFPIRFFVQGEPYRLLGFIPARTHLFGIEGDVATSPRLHLLGTDALGRDRFSRLLIAIRFSLIVCTIGALVAWAIGILIGLVSGYSNRLTDTFLMGVADTMLAMPTLILILAARAAFPLDLSPLRAATLIVVIFALTGWAEIARLTRGLVRSLKEREFVLAARSIGLTEPRILFRHILPNALPTLTTQAAVMLPYFLLSETALSFLGVGLQEPQPSLGNMLAAAADLTQLQRSPVVLLAPGIVIFIFVFAVRVLTGRRT